MLKAKPHSMNQSMVRREVQVPEKIGVPQLIPSCSQERRGVGSLTFAGGKGLPSVATQWLIDLGLMAPYCICVCWLPCLSHKLTSQLMTDCGKRWHGIIGLGV